MSSHIREYIDIPEEFFDSDTGKPFSHCIGCNKYLLTVGTPYIIERALKQNLKYKTRDVIIEYAMCEQCLAETRESFSEESIQKLNDYFNQNSDLVNRRVELIHDEKTNYKNWISHCLIKGTPRDQLTEYQYACQCDGPYLLFHHMPIMIGGEAIDEISMLLSSKTRDEIDRFYDKFFPVPTEFQPFFDDHKILIL
jgi:hypothetical protein